MKIIQVPVLLTSLILAGCSESGSDQDNAVVGVEGVWRGTMINSGVESYDLIALGTKDGALFTYGDPYNGLEANDDVDSVFVKVDEDKWGWANRSIVSIVAACELSRPSGVSAEGSCHYPEVEVVPGQSISARFEYDHYAGVEVLGQEAPQAGLNGDTVYELSLSYDPVYTRDASFNLLEGQYTLTEGEFIFTFQVDTLGRIEGNDNQGCVVTGKAEIPDKRFNLYKLALEVSNCEAQNIYEGILAVLLDDGGRYNDTLFIKSVAFPLNDSDNMNSGSLTDIIYNPLARYPRTGKAVRL